MFQSTVFKLCRDGSSWVSRLLNAALWSPEGKGLTLGFCCDVYCDFVTFPFGILWQVWYLIVSIPDPCCLSYFEPVLSKD